MRLTREASSSAALYAAGMAVNLLFLVVLISSPVARHNLQIPEGIYQDNLWKGSDVLTYVRPARNFIETGVVGHGQTPDHHRTAGFPLLIATFMWVFGEYWLGAYVLAIAVFSAAVYPALARIQDILFGSDAVMKIVLTGYLLMSAAYWALIPAVLSDQVFAVLFIVGFACGLSAVVSQSWVMFVAQLVCVSGAAQVRPTLVIFPMINLLLMWAVAQRHGLTRNPRVKLILIGSFAVLLVTCNGPTIRNYLNHGFARPSDIPSINLFRYLGRGVLLDVGEGARFEAMKAQVEACDGLKEADALRIRYALGIFRAYPVQTAVRAALNGGRLLFGSYWSQVGHYWGYHWRAGSGGEFMPLKASPVLLAASVGWGAVYLFFLAGFVVCAWGLLSSRQVALVVGVLLLVFSFLGPAVMVQQGPRMRLPVEGIMVMFALYGLRTCRSGRMRSSGRRQRETATRVFVPEITATNQTPHASTREGMVIVGGAGAEEGGGGRKGGDQDE